jgi:MFS family permease
MVSIDIYVMLLALPHLSASLGAGSTQQLWVTDVYGFPLAGFLVTMGALGDRIPAGQPADGRGGRPGHRAGRTAAGRRAIRSVPRYR